MRLTGRLAAWSRPAEPVRERGSSSVPAVRKDGERISVEFTIVPLKDEIGRMVGMAALMRDVTKRFEEMKALRRQLAAAAERAASG